MDELQSQTCGNGNTQERDYSDPNRGKKNPREGLVAESHESFKIVIEWNDEYNDHNSKIDHADQKSH